MMKVPAPSPFDKIDPRDGYRCTTYASADEGLRVSVEMYSLGERLKGADVYVNNVPQNVDIGVASRLHSFMEALCRYFNCGGSWDELNLALEQAETVILGGLQFEGWVFLDTVDSDDGEAYRWVEDATGRIAVWVADEYIETDCGNINDSAVGGDDGDLVHVQPQGDGRDA